MVCFRYEFIAINPEDGCFCLSAFISSHGKSFDHSNCNTRFVIYYFSCFLSVMQFSCSHHCSVTNFISSLILYCLQARRVINVYSHTWSTQLVTHTHTHTRLTALCPGLPGWAGTRKVKPIWILLKQETVSGIGISWAICKSAPRSRQITMPAPHCSVFYRPDAVPATQPTASKHWRL